MRFFKCIVNIQNNRYWSAYTPNTEVKLTEIINHTVPEISWQKLNLVFNRLFVVKHVSELNEIISNTCSIRQQMILIRILQTGYVFRWRLCTSSLYRSKWKVIMCVCVCGELRNTTVGGPTLADLSWVYGYITCRKVGFPTYGRHCSRRRPCWGLNKIGCWTEPRRTATSPHPSSTMARTQGWLWQIWQTAARTAWKTWNKHPITY